MKNFVLAVTAASAMLASSVVMSDDTDYAAQAREIHGMEKPVSMLNINFFTGHVSMHSEVIPTMYERQQSRLEELAERRED